MATIFELEEAANSAQADYYNAQVTGDPTAIANAQAQLTYTQGTLAAAYNGSTVTATQAAAIQSATGNAATVTPDGTGNYTVTATAPPAPPPPAPVQTAQPVSLPSAPTTTPTTPTTPGTTFKPNIVSPFDPGTPTDYCAAYPEDPYCQFYSNLGSLFTDIAGPTIVNESVVINETGLLASDVQQLIDNGLSGLWGAVVTGVDDAMQAVIATVQTAVTGIGNALKAAYAWLSRLAGMVLSLLKTILQDILNALVKAVQDLEQAVKDLYQNILKPIAQTLQNIRDRLLDLWKKFIAPMLVFLQDIRRILVILELFHVKFAQKLDNAIQDFERRVTAPLFYLLGYINAVSNWINLIVAVNYLLQKPLFLNSLNAYVGESINLQANAMNKPISPATLAAAQASAAVPNAQQSSADATQFIQTGTGAYAPIAAARDVEFQQYLEGIF